MTYGTWKVLCTHKGEVYAETMAGLFLYDAKTDTFLQFVPRLPDGKLRFEDIYKNTFTLDSLRNGFWMGTDAGIVFFDLEKRRYVDRHEHPGNWDVFNGNNVVPLTMDRKGRLVFSDNTTRELVTWDPANNARAAMSTGPWHANREYISTIYVDAQDNKWISTWLPSMYFIEAATGEVRRFAHDPEDEYTVAGNFFWDVHQDDDGTVYLGTINGLSITNLGRSFFSILELPDSISHRTYYFGSLLLGEDHQRKLWFAPSFQYLLRYDLETGRYTKFDVFKGLVKPGPGKRLLVEAMKATEKTIYFGSKVGLFTFDIATETFARMSEIPDSIVNGAWDVKFMEVTRNGELWVACHHVGMLRHNLRTHESRMYRHDPADPHSCAPDLITYLKEDENGEIWLNSGKKGPFRYDRKADRFEYLLAQGTVQTGEGISAFARDKSGNFWLLNTVKGLLRYDPKTRAIDHRIPREFLSHNAYGSMVMDANQQLWLTFYNDFSILDTRDLTVENFTIQHSREDLKWWNYLGLISDGRIVSESRNAIIVFDPKVRRTATVTDPLTITNLVAGDTLFSFLPQDEVIELAHWQNYFSLDFGTLGMAKGAGLKFEYKLEGFDADWVDCGARRTAYYTNVPGGNYNFKVRVSDAKGIWHEGRQTVQIRVESIFYKTGLFRLLLALSLIAILVWWANQRRRRSAKKVNDRAISYFANSRFGSNNVNDVLWDITQNVITLTELVDCVVYLVDENGEKLVQKAAFGEKNPSGQEILNVLEIPVGQGIVGTVAKTGIAEIIPDTRRDPRYIPDAGQRLSEIAVPIIYEGKVIGVIDSEHPRRNFFTAAHLEMLQTVASISATKISSALRESEIREKEARLRELTTLVSETRQLALRAQMNPHFIFNCLNSINSFILDNHQDTASRYLIKFAKLIRLILENSNSKFIPLQSELDALKLYIEMESLRFETKFTWEVLVDEDVAAHHIMVPPLILQPFVENAIWHGLLHKSGPGTLVVAVTQPENTLICTITDNGVGRDASREFKSASLNQKQSLGLKLTQERLALMHEQEKKKFKVEIIDLFDAGGVAAGTQVIIEMELSE
jgi:ligand-binding sensor domain-containing protein/putative methionine-R-sulfoxide reductase with GAF domain